jgi:hypothetical protein
MRGEKALRDKLRVDPQVKIIIKQNRLLLKRQKEQDKIIKDLSNRLKEIESNTPKPKPRTSIINKPIPKPRTKLTPIEDLPPPPPDFFNDVEPVYHTAEEVDSIEQEQAIIHGFELQSYKTFGKSGIEFYYKAIEPYKIIDLFFEDFKRIEKKKLGIFLNNKPHKPIRLFHKIQTEFKKPIKNDDGKDDWEYFIHWYNESYYPVIYNNIYDFEDNYSQFQSDYERWIEDEERKGSLIKFVSIHRVVLYMGKFNPMSAGSYIPLPFNSHTIRNIQNNDSYCFKYAIYASNYEPKEHKYKAYHYKGLEYLLTFSMEEIKQFRVTTPSDLPYYKTIQNILHIKTDKEIEEMKKINFTGMNFPVTVNDIQLFEENNPDYCIMIYTMKLKSSDSNDESIDWEAVNNNVNKRKSVYKRDDFEVLPAIYYGVPKVMRTHP